MALTLALPLFGLDPEHFSTLSMKLLNIEREQNLRNLSDSGRTSPSTGSESSGISSLATSAESTSVELTPISSRPETPTRASCKSQEKVNIMRVRIGTNNSELNIKRNCRNVTSREKKREKCRRNYFLKNCLVKKYTLLLKDTHSLKYI